MTNYIFQSMTKYKNYPAYILSIKHAYQFNRAQHFFAFTPIHAYIEKVTHLDPIKSFIF